MLKIRKYAAIDIGSNAVRLLISTITEPENKETTFKKTSLVRVPIRLGADVFINGKISQENMVRMKDTMRAYSLLMKSHKIEKYKACATSAMRDANNGKELAAHILEDSGIDIEIIDGEHEAAIIAATDLHELIQDDKTYLYVDVGGGSTEFTLYSEGKTIASRSFKLGTVRLLNNMIDDSLWQEAEKWVKEQTKKYTKISLIGSGGNINNIFKSSGKKIGKPLSYLYLSSYYQLLNSLTYEDRISQLGMNTDRADVIIPATKIYLSAMKWSRSRKVYVPKIGLADGIIKSIYNETKKSE
ncbi:MULTISPECIES: Ppx/GppA phosphatase family protein [Mesonia]|mgnify:CR=1 FL=1|uniref:Guanosine-5'-triphosphate,3'-diphosphate pyrophosphatase n=1 Tax=Mesonia oceanica TaxID=2687242 RepID=A0AC61Y728_9FLAO|nr:MULTISPECIES: exopolyphosphatase [Mesonia]MAN26731.1 exopolyphosphatase [Mesonia sp.]MAQ40435.1 exopolyphosphatase [Mesonia sp.]MBJ98056.1 exopolyphosphatase [Flavobacteriaceae bacterium]VVV00272.1 Guanosine-5'-triphosphate,3'-diphosphate pyrophosphatase [Mesonia oceanica]